MSLATDRWFWFTVVSVILVLVVPLAVVWIILQVEPPEIRVVATISIIVIWSVVSGYKDWVISKRREAEKKVPEA